MKTEYYSSRDLRRLPGITYDTLRTWAGRRNDAEKRSGKQPHQPVLLSPIQKPGKTHSWKYGSDAVEQIWRIKMLQMLGYKNSEIERMLNASNSEAENDIWDTLDAKIRNLQWKERHLRAAKWFAENIRASGKLPHFPRKDTVDDIDRYLEVLPVDPKSVTSDYETGAEMLLSAHDYDRAAIIEQSSSTEYRKRREEILLAIRTLRIRHIPANSAQVFSLIDVLYEEQFESQGLDLDVFHEYGNQIIVQKDFTRSIDDKYDLGFSAYLAEAVFIYCFICSLQRDDQQGEKAYE